MKKMFSLLLAALFVCGTALFAFAEDAVYTKPLRVISFNVDGLPIPAALSSTKRPAAEATRLLARQVNDAGCDILCAQEDFNYHGILSRELDMDYRTVTSGPAVVGDGLNIFSKTPIYNVRRVAWEAAYGVFDCGSDELTPKGVLCCTVEIDPGVFVDVYTLHADAWEDDDSMLAKAAQFDQLLNLISEYSGADRAVLLTGDFNTNYTTFREGYAAGHYNVDLCQKLLDNFVANGFRDAWVEANADGRYDFTSAEMYARYGAPYPRTWDTLDHIYYRDGADVTFTLESACYDDMDCDAITWPGHLSDHAAVRAEFICTIDKTNTAAPETLVRERANPLRAFFRGVAAIAKTLWTAISHLPDLFKNGIGWIK
ncbi:MAG: endonuclease/exonuclease/phosphatase family protein [Clostridia bacterium]|nr:endonuclease/exonuclease/phosphatase family protein [Clostridia bacterium]